MCVCDLCAFPTHITPAVGGTAVWHSHDLLPAGTLSQSGACWWPGLCALHVPYSSFKDSAQHIASYSVFFFSFFLLTEHWI